MLSFMQQAHTRPRVARAGVLVIEEHPFQRRALAKRLNDLGVPRVLQAARAADALELLGARADPIALILSSVDLPEVDSLELLRALARALAANANAPQANAPTTDAPHTAVALLSTRERPLLRRIETAAGASGLNLIGMLEKPVSDDELRAVLLRALAGSGRDGHFMVVSRSMFG